MAKPYVTREELAREIILSKKRFRESNYPVTPAECFTPNLTKYLRMMVERYGNKGQWRGYCVDEATECLTKRGWLNIDTVTDTDADMILSCSKGRLAWSRIKSVYRGRFNGKMFKLDVQGLDALVTPGHRFLTTFGLKKVEYLREKDKIVLMGGAVAAPEPSYSDAFVELVGCTSVPTMAFILALSQDQRELLIQTMIDADGHRSNGLNYTQCSKDHVDVFLALCTIAGYRTSCHHKPPVSYGKKPYHSIHLFSDRAPHSVVENIDFHGAKNPNRVIGKPKSLYPNEPNFDYNGRVWCPETEYGTFIARRNGYIYLTGNSYIEDMKSDALVTLCQNCFKYDETRFDNPFGYLTQIIKYCFITFLEKEEIIRDIKDSLWESIGMTPSYARQIRNEMLRDVGDTSTKGLKALKKDVDALQEKVDALADLGSKITRLREPDIELDQAISELLGIEPQPFTADRDATMALFQQDPAFYVEEGVEVAGQVVNCLSVRDASTASQTKRVIIDTSENTVTLALCAIGLSLRRDLMVKRLREISGYNLSPHFPTEDKSQDPDTDQSFTDPAPEQAKRRRKRA